MQHKNRFLNTAVAGLALAVALAFARDARAEDYGPLNAAETLRQMPVLCRTLGIGCSISADAYAALTGATGGDRESQFKLARLLQRGEGIARDERAATGWFGKAAEQGHVAAALELNHLRREGVAIPADEAKIAASLGLAVEKSDLDAMRALAEMQIEGRGLPRNPEQGLGLLRHAVTAGSALAAQDLANLYLRGAPGIPKDPAEGFRSMAASARLGNAAAMLELGSLYFKYPEPKMVDPAEGYRWLMRAVLADDPAAQEMLSGVLADGAMAGARTVIAPDIVAADVWLRLAARSPFHDNSSLRRRIEANMTAAQLDEAQTRAAAWQPHPVQGVLAMAIELPAAVEAKRPWPPGLQGRALDRFKEGGDNPAEWQQLPDFAQGEQVMAAITAIAAYCDGNGNKRCADNCRGQLDYVAPPVKPGGFSAAELARYLQQHAVVSAVRAMRKEAATPEQTMRYWVLCAYGVESGL